MRTWKGGHASDYRLSDAEIEILFRACRTPHQRHHIAGLLFTGMRVGEWAHLSASWVSFAAGTITIPLAVPCQCARCIRLLGGTWRPKTPNSARIVPLLEPPLAEAVRWKLAHDGARPWDIWAIQCSIHRAARAAGISKPVSPHTLRATRAYQVAEWGVGAGDLLAYFGWASLKEAAPYIRAAQQARAAVNVRWHYGQFTRRPHFPTMGQGQTRLGGFA